MINHKLSEIKIPEDLQKKVNKYNIPGGWELSEKCILDFKSKVKDLLNQNQDGKCAYCGLPLNSRNPEIDHIAPKGGSKRSKYPECMFLTSNLVYSCHNCNSSECKGQTDTVESKNGSDDYNLWSFKIVHPYFDDPRDYFEISNADDILVLVKKGNSGEKKQKAEFTIKLFRLDSEQKLTEQAKELAFKRNPEKVNNLIKEISTYRPD